jgi:hypothetical protein
MNQLVRVETQRRLAAFARFLEATIQDRLKTCSTAAGHFGL